MALFALPLLLAISACSSTQPIQPTSFINYQVPAPIRSCGAQPARLTGEFTQRDVAVYIVRLRAWGEGCAGNLSAVNQVITNAERELLSRAVN